MGNVIVAHRALVLGLAVTGEAVARALRAHGTEVVAVDDNPTEAIRANATNLGIQLLEAGDVLSRAGLLEQVLDEVDLVLPSPGVPAHHLVFALAAERGLRVWSEFELAARWSSLPMVAITGTNGKTTVTTLVTAMLLASGLSAMAVGNAEVPLVEVLDRGLDVAVVEASSFRLQFTETFRPSVAVWLNLAEDHLDWHSSMAEYADAKARIWVNQSGTDLAVVNADDPAVMTAAEHAPARVECFSVTGGADWCWDRSRDVLSGPDGAELVAVADLPRRLPHDVANALAACAAAVAAGATHEACASVLTTFTGLPHRITLVGHAWGVAYYDDSKATTPASVLAAVTGFESVVLIAGGLNKGLDLSVLAGAVPPVRSVIAMGRDSEAVLSVFRGHVPVEVAESMDEAVSLAAGVARPGDAVLLSPGCASFDQFESYAHRGNEFARAVRALSRDGGQR